MNALSQTSRLLREHGIRLRKDLGQNFLVDEEFIHHIVQAAEVKKQDEVLEIGAGIGSLTRHLAQTAGRVCAVEIDEQLFALLDERMRSYKNVTLIQGDIMRLRVHDLVSQQGYKVVANIPYYLTSNLIRRLLESEPRPQSLTLTIQREVAERVCARAGQMSQLSASVQVYGEPRIALTIPPGAFLPPPKIESATLVVELFRKPLIPADKLDLFFRIIKAAFSQKRKMLRNTLPAGLHMDSNRVEELLIQAEINPQRRAQTVSIPEWRRLVEQFPAE